MMKIKNNVIVLQMRRIYNIKDYTIEKLVDYIYYNKLDVASLTKKLEDSQLAEKEKTSLRKKIVLANERLEKPLDIQQIILFVIFPFGITSIFNSDYDSDYKLFVKYNYKKKIRQYFWFSLIGFFMYIVLALFIGILLR